MHIFLENLNYYVSKETFVIISIGYLPTKYKNNKYEASGHICVASRNEKTNKLCVSHFFNDFVHDFFLYSPDLEIIIDLNNANNHNNLQFIDSIQIIMFN
jgi:hypothetical protein